MDSRAISIAIRRVWSDSLAPDLLRVANQVAENEGPGKRYLSVNDVALDILGEDACFAAYADCDKITVLSNDLAVVGFAAASIKMPRTEASAELRLDVKVPVTVVPAMQHTDCASMLLNAIYAFAREKGIACVTFGEEEKRIPESVAWKGDELPYDQFTFCDRSLNRTLMTERGTMISAIVDEGRKKLNRQILAENLRQFHREKKNMYELRKRVCRTGIMEDTFGCGKCRWSINGCGRCRAPDFVHGAKEGKIGGIPRPNTEIGMQIVGEPGDGGGVREKGLVLTADTPISRNISKAAGIKAWGLLTTREIARGQPVIEYVGEVLTSEQAAIREYECYQKRGFQNSYALHTGNHANHVIDTTLFGNCARFINHSCDPNLKMKMWQPSDKSKQVLTNLPRVMFFATRKVRPGEELTFDYGASLRIAPKCDESGSRPSKRPRQQRSAAVSQQQTPSTPQSANEGTIKCLCGAPLCRKWLA